MPCYANVLPRLDHDHLVAALLSQRLERLEALGVVDKTVESTMPPRTRYRLTDAGPELELVIDAIDRWGQAHMRRDDAVVTVAGASGGLGGSSHQDKGRARASR